MKTYQNLVFDVGDVLLSYRWKAMLMDYGLSEKDALRVGPEMFDEPKHLWEELDFGRRSDEEIIRDFEAEFPDDAKVIRWFITHGEYMSVPRPRVWERVHELKEKGYRIYLLSNYSADLFHKHTEYADFMKDIDGLMVSYMIQKRKPDPAIYQALFEKYSLDPADCIFFDDRLENVNQAKLLGMDAEQVLSPEDLLKKLERF